MLLGNLQDWILAMTMALTPSMSATTVESSQPTDFCESMSAQAAPSIEESASFALRELQRARRVLEVAETDTSFASVDYMQALSSVCEKYDDNVLRELSMADLAAAIQGLATDLGLAFAALEASTTDARSWSRIVRAADPEEDVIRFPRRFVREVDTVPEEDGWTDLDHEVWG